MVCSLSKEHAVQSADLMRSLSLVRVPMNSPTRAGLVLVEVVFHRGSYQPEEATNFDPRDTVPNTRKE